MLPSAEALHLRKVRKILLRSLHRSFLKAVKAEERAADGRMKSSEAVTEHGWDCSEETCRRTCPPSLLRLMPFARNGPTHFWLIAHASKDQDAAVTVERSARMEKHGYTAHRGEIRHALGWTVQLDCDSVIHQLKPHAAPAGAR